MILEDLYQRAMKRRAEVVEFCDRVGFKQTAGDLMGNLENIHQRVNYIKWTYAPHTSDTPKSQRARDMATMWIMIEDMAEAIELYLYAKEHGIEAAMLWKLGKLS